MLALGAATGTAAGSAAAKANVVGRAAFASKEAVGAAVAGGTEVVRQMTERGSTTAAHYISRLQPGTQQKVISGIRSGARMAKTGSRTTANLGTQASAYSQRAAWWLTHSQSGAIASGGGQGLAGVPPGFSAIPTTYPGTQALSGAATTILMKELEEQQ